MTDSHDRRAEAYYRALIENVAEVVTVVDADGLVRYISPAVERLMQLPASTYLGHPVLDGVHPDDVPPLEALMADLLAQPGGSRPADFRRRNAAGEWRVFSAVATNLLDDPAVRGIVINSRDVTARRQLEQQLRQAQKMEAIGQLAGGLAHDFNNLLSVIGRTSDLLHASLHDLGDPRATDEDRRRLLLGMRGDVAEIRRTADRAAALTAQLLAVSRQQVVQREVLDLDTVVRGVEGLLRRVLHERIVLSCLATCGQRWVRVDRGQVEQVLLNLAVNARDAMPDGGALSVETGCFTLASARASAMGPMPPGRYVVLSVRDTGTGMDEATRARIFEPFFTTKLEGKGTGLGLATVLSIVEQSGGYLAVTSAPGRGSTFDIFLPESTPPAAVAPPPVAPGARERADATGTVLVVEDEQAVRTMLRRILQAQGYRVLEARHGADALLIAGDEGAAIDLVLTDMMMPEMGGAELLAALHQLRPTLPAIVVSGYAPELSATADDGSGAVPPSPAHFLAKPFTADGVLRVVRDVLDRRPAGMAAGH